MHTSLRFRTHRTANTCPQYGITSYRGHADGAQASCPGRNIEQCHGNGICSRAACAICLRGGADLKVMQEDEIRTIRFASTLEELGIEMRQSQKWRRTPSKIAVIET